MCLFICLMNRAGQIPRPLVGSVCQHIHFSFLDSEQRIIASKVIKRCVITFRSLDLLFYQCCRSLASFFTPRRLRSLLNTTSSWQLTSLIVLSSLRASRPLQQRRHREYIIVWQLHSPTLHAVYRPQSLLSGMNRFLASLEITFRRDPTNFRPRVNKLNSIKDREQKGMLL